jgi:GNAT superfamily N-acetyltransferase
MRPVGEPSAPATPGVRFRSHALADAVAISRYADEELHWIAADLVHLERITPGGADPVAHGRDLVIASPEGRAITAAVAGRLVGFVLCAPGHALGEPGLGPAETGVSAERSGEFTRSALRVFAPVVAPAAAGLGVGELLLDAARREWPDGRIFTVLPGGHPGNRLARAAGWHEVLRGGPGMQLLLHPGHPALKTILLEA